LKNSLFISLLAGSPTSIIKHLADYWRQVATAIGDSLDDHGYWERLKSDNGINPSRMLQSLWPCLIKGCEIGPRVAVRRSRVRGYRRRV